MADNPKEHSLKPEEFNHAWRVVTVAGALGATYYTLCVNGAPRVKFLTHLHTTPFHFGLIATLGSLAMAFQLIGGPVSRWARARKMVWIGLAIAHRLAIVGVLAAPALFDSAQGRIWWIILMIFLHDGLANLGAPMWFSWMADIVPRDTMNRLWARRQRITTGVSTAAAIAMAFFFYEFEKSGQVVLGYVLVGGIGLALGLVDILLFLKVPEPPCEWDEGVGLIESILQPLRDPKFRPFVWFLAYYYFSLLLALPFFSVYMVDVLKVSARNLQFILVAYAIGVVLSIRFWGLLCDTYGQRPAMQISLVGKAFFPLAFLLAPHIPNVAVAIFSIALFADGLMDAGGILATQGMVLKNSPRRNRQMYIAATNCIAIGLVAGVAPLLSGAFIDAMGSWHVQTGVYRFSAFHLVFAASLVLRIGACFLAARLPDPQNIPLSVALKHLRHANPLKVTRALWRLNEERGADARAAAARRLGELGSPMAIRDLIRALNDGSEQLRGAAGHALAAIGTSEASEPLAAALFDGAPRVRSEAARTLGKIGDATSLRALLRSLAAMDKESLGDVVDSLGRIGDWSAILPLMCLLEDADDPLLRRKIASALGRLSAIQSEDEVMSLLSGGAGSERAS